MDILSWGIKGIKKVVKGDLAVLRLYMALLFLFSGAVFGDSKVNLFSPGKLSKYHKDLEGSKNCSQCHVQQDKATIEEKSCFKCHNALEKRVKTKKGYHNNARNIEKKNCEQCHKEHFGDRFELVTWPDKKGYKEFNHDLTGYILKGVHKKADCEDCHKKELIKDKSLFKDKNVNIKRTYLGLGTDCVSCHPNNLHKDEIDDDNCSKCHNENDFRDARVEFNHEQTDFSLRGQHKEVNCESCHKPLGKVFYQDKWRVRLKHKNIKHEKCLDCHKTDDIHENKFGESCESCHTETSFNDIIFDKKDHAIETFPLKGKHLDVTCQSCHTDKLNKIPESMTCVSCHKKDDPHRNKFGETCESCHTEEGFNIIEEDKFNHDVTGYILEGHHKNLSCVKCHSLKGDYKKRFLIYNKEKGCITCHKNDDVHNEEFKDQGCNECHNQNKFKPSDFTIEKHNKTEFKLDGSHEMVSCNQCHKPYKKDKTKPLLKNTRFIKKDYTNMVLTFHTEDKNCVDCHENPHIGQFEDIIKKDGCEKCHTTDSFHKVLFDHNKDTNFKLINSHKDASCQRCHEYKKDKKHQFKGYFLYTQNKDKDCSYCHTDIHYGQFKEKKCADCHTDVSWDDLTLFDHNRDTKFKLDGKHAKIDCEDCHKPVKLKDTERIKYKIEKYSCIDCHDSYHTDK